MWIGNEGGLGMKLGRTRHADSWATSVTTLWRWSTHKTIAGKGGQTGAPLCTASPRFPSQAWKLQHSWEACSQLCPLPPQLCPASLPSDPPSLLRLPQWVELVQCPWQNAWGERERRGSCVAGPRQSLVLGQRDADVKRQTCSLRLHGGKESWGATAGGGAAAAAWRVKSQAPPSLARC